MKPITQIWILPVLLIVLCMFSSCTDYFYTRPQPVDGKNMAVFPKQVLGSWYDIDDNSTISVLMIGKQRVDIYNQDSEKIVRGYRFQEDTQQHRGYHAWYTLQYDSLNSKTDTLQRYIERNGLLFKVNDKKMLEKGYPYTQDHDTLIMHKSDTIRFDLGGNAILREISSDLYVLNVNSNLTGDESGNWWRLYIFGLNNDGTLSTYAHEDKILKLPEMFYQQPDLQYGKTYYFDPYWTKADLLRLIQNGYFEKENALVRK